MRVIIAGSRGYRWLYATPLEEIADAVAESGFEVTRVLSGGAYGPDKGGETWARNAGIPVDVHPADWRTHGKGAGPRRNAYMVAHADALIALWDGRSKGTADIIRKAHAAGLRTYVHHRATHQGRRVTA